MPPKVIATTSSFSKKTTEYFRDIYERNGGKGSSLTVLPFNQGSVHDVRELVSYIYSNVNPVGVVDAVNLGIGWIGDGH